MNIIRDYIEKKLKFGDEITLLIFIFSTCSHSQDREPSPLGQWSRYHLCSTMSNDQLLDNQIVKIFIFVYSVSTKIFPGLYTLQLFIIA